MSAATVLIDGITFYLYLGGAVAAVFLLFGIDRVDPSSHGSYAFRPLLIPGICLLWPLVLYRWSQLEKQGREEKGGIQ